MAERVEFDITDRPRLLDGEAESTIKPPDARAQGEHVHLAVSSPPLPICSPRLDAVVDGIVDRRPLHAPEPAGQRDDMGRGKPTKRPSAMVMR